MNFGKKSVIESYAIENSLADKIYGEGSSDPHHKLLSDICHILNDGLKEIEQDFICLVEQKAIDAFVKFANEVYSSINIENSIKQHRLVFSKLNEPSQETILSKKKALLVSNI